MLIAAKNALVLPRPSHLAFRFAPRQPLISTALPRRFSMDQVIEEPSPDKLKVLPHRQYVTGDHLTPSTALPDPLDQFRAWFKEAVEGDDVNEAENMTLSTATPNGIPSARMVLLKQVDSRGFVFYTNYTSRKSQELTQNPHAALTFFWREVHRSVRVIGRAEKVTRQESEEYWKSRPLGSRLGALASKQSTVIGEGVLDARLQKLRERFGVSPDAKDADIPIPEFWGGWRIIPDEVEFWSGKPSRLHDRIRYLRTESSTDEHPAWKIERLSP